MFDHNDNGLAELCQGWVRKPLMMLLYIRGCTFLGNACLVEELPDPIQDNPYIVACDLA
jgi:hypothetical protein